MSAFSVSTLIINKPSDKFKQILLKWKILELELLQKR